MTVRVPSPWRVLAGTDLLLVRAAIPEAGRYYHRERAIVLRDGLLLVEERTALWHELVHARRGDEECRSIAHFARRQEATCDREAARWAIPFPSLLAAARGARHVEEVADSLKILPPLLRLRLDGLHPSERAALRRALELEERAA